MVAHVGATSLPRPRGDGPTLQAKPVTVPPSPPPTRGWTHRRRPVDRRDRVSPAHAGMDPTATSRPSCSRSLPRPRGDGPATGVSVEVDALSPPPTRGWTPVAAAAVDGMRVSPAHAGMDPDSSACAATRQRLPRPRGDGPALSRTGPGQVGSPPPTRGWTQHRQHRGRARDVSPAHAGMDPPWTADAPTLPCLPRPRGDGPVSVNANTRVFASPPPTRGWTLHPTHRERGVTVSPAHAGMDPSWRQGWRTGTRLPRPRGDGPEVAGLRSRFTLSPPPTRGWTRVRRVDPVGIRVSPAHAGMDPLTRCHVLMERRLPRPRGDGP